MALGFRVLRCPETLSVGHIYICMFMVVVFLVSVLVLRFVEAYGS